MTQDSQPDADDRHASPSDVPLVVSLDGALIRSNLAIEAAFAALASRPVDALRCCVGRAGGRARLRACIAGLVELDPATLPYDDDVLALIAQARCEGRRVYLATSIDDRLAQAVASHLGVFDGTFGSTPQRDLTGDHRADRLVEAFGAGGFDYVGASRDDLPAFERARMAIVAAGRADLQRRLKTSRSTVLPGRPYKLARILDAIRLEQWSKNLLVFVPILTSLKLNAATVTSATALFIAFSLCASAGYIFNDLVDLRSDRRHPEKRRRPFAAMDVPLGVGLALIPALLVAAGAIALALSADVARILLVYLAATTAYSLVLKRKLLLDVITLGSLYTLRVYAGAVAIGVPLSGWLLLFSIFIFTSLALVKRCSEMTLRLGNGLSDPTDRDYRASDLPALFSVAAAAAFSAVVIFALYVESDAVRAIYARPENLLFAVPVLVYWLARIMILAHRGLIVIDPIMFALRDRASWACALLTAAIIVSAV